MSRSNVKAVRVSLILDIVVPEGMEERGEDEVFAMLREADDGELRGAFEYSDDDPVHIMDYIWEDWEARQEGDEDTAVCDVCGLVADRDFMTKAEKKGPMVCDGCRQADQEGEA